VSTQSRPFSRRVVVSSVMEARNAHNLETLQSYGWKQAGALLPDSTHEPSVKRVVTLGPITLVEKVIHMAQADAQRRDSEWRPGVPTPGLLDRGDKRGIARGHRSSGFLEFRTPVASVTTTLTRHNKCRCLDRVPAASRLLERNC